MKRHLLLALCLHIFLLFPLAASDTMHVSYGKVSMKLPPGWLVQSVSDATIMFVLYSPEEINDRFRERITITSGSVDKDTNKAYIRDVKDNFLSYYEMYTVLEDGGSHMMVTGWLNGLHVKQYIKFIIRKKISYCITATALPDTYDYWEPVFKRIIGSISIKN